MTRIILIGYMGAGKTTIGKALARQLGIMFYDLDWYVENRMRKSIAQIFDESGEDGFREIEHNMLHEVAEFEDIVLSCGGGTPCFFDNMDYLNRQGETLYLKASPEVLARHLRMGKNIRPLIQGKDEAQLLEYIKDSLAKREPFYSKARHTLDIDVLDNLQKIEHSVEEARCTLGI